MSSSLALLEAVPPLAFPPWLYICTAVVSLGRAGTVQEATPLCSGFPHPLVCSRGGVNFWDGAHEGLYALSTMCFLGFLFHSVWGTLSSSQDRLSMQAWPSPSHWLVVQDICAFVNFFQHFVVSLPSSLPPPPLLPHFSSSACANIVVTTLFKKNSVFSLMDLAPLPNLIDHKWKGLILDSQLYQTDLYTLSLILHFITVDIFKIKNMRFLVLLFLKIVLVILGL